MVEAKRRETAAARRQQAHKPSPSCGHNTFSRKPSVFANNEKARYDSGWRRAYEGGSKS